MIDYHIHLERGPYSLAWLQEFWDQAQIQGVSELGITEHTHQFKEFLPAYDHLWKSGSDSRTTSWLRDQFGNSLQDYLRLLDAGRNLGIPLKIGLEVDYFPESEGVMRTLLQGYDFDFLLGSVHFLGNWSFDWKPEAGWPDRDPDQAYLAYVELMEKMVLSNLVDVVAHLDVIKVFGHRASRNLEDKWGVLLQHIADADLAIEVSTAGLRKPVEEIYPRPALLRQAARLKIPITIASDAHVPQDVGDRWRKGVALAKASGYDSYCSFKGRKRINHRLPSL